MPVSPESALHQWFEHVWNKGDEASISIEHSMEKGEFAMAHCRVTATHTGDGLGVPATNKPVEFWGFTLARVVDGQLVEGWNSFDFLGMYEQIGVRLDMPSAG